MPTTNITAALRPISGYYRREVRNQLERRGLPTAGPLNSELRKELENAIFAVESELEHRSVAHGGLAHPQVAVMRSVRNVLLDEIPVSLGGNETRPGLHWLVIERAAATMHERRRGGNAAALLEARAQKGGGQRPEGEAP